MAADTRQYKSKEQDGQGNEVIIRDQQLVEQSSQTTMASGEYFEIVDVDGRMAKIPKANMVDIVREALGSLLNGLTDQTTVTKVPSLNGNTLGASTVATLASVLGVPTKTSVMNWTFSGTSTAVDDLDNANYGIRRWGSSSKNRPEGSGTVFTFELYQTRKAQMAFSINGNVYYRYQNGDLEWQAWVTK